MVERIDRASLKAGVAIGRFNALKIEKSRITSGGCGDLKDWFAQKFGTTQVTRQKMNRGRVLYSYYLTPF